MIKIVIPLRKRILKDGSSWPPFDSESVWAIPDGHAYRIDNVTFYSDALNYGDVVEASPSGHAEVFNFERIVRKSGHSTIRIILIDDSAAPRAEAAAESLESMGCSWESAGETVAFDIPPNIPLTRASDVLKQFETDALMEIEVLDGSADS